MNGKVIGDGACMYTMTREEVANLREREREREEIKSEKQPNTVLTGKFGEYYIWRMSHLSVIGGF